jgi:isopentenyl diphosphate isomerase/L-lactate dehydrogenase-like FMN-dependent dehydrogenase
MNNFVNLLELEALAKEKLPESIFGYYVSGANDEITLKDNRQAYDQLKLYPYVLRDVSERNMQIQLLGKTQPTPLLICPMALQRMAHPDGEIGMVQAAGKFGVPMIVSTMASTTIEEIAAHRKAPVFFQLYVYKNRQISEELVRRAEASGYEALVLTVDTPMLGRRERDIRNNYRIPDEFAPANLPIRNVNSDSQESGIELFFKTLLRSDDMTWESIAWLRTLTKVPIFVKGVLRTDDAKKAVDAGVDGIIVSNHGGRQLDTVPSTISVLPNIAKAVNRQVPVLVDGGVRRGTDVVKAIALGATGVMIGRPFLWALAHGGQAGVEHALGLLTAEIDLAMALIGVKNISEITEDLMHG